ncbi:MAG: GNAT family N-acetyltransferase, partial [Candidatus Magasanikbacteria bacterium]
NGISNHKDTPIFLKLYFKAIIDRSDYNDLLIGSRVATSDQAGDKYTRGVEKFHDSSLARIDFEFSSKIKTRLFKDRDSVANRGGTSLGWAKNSIPLPVNFWREKVDQDNVEVVLEDENGVESDGQDLLPDSELRIEGEYFVSALSPEAIGIYSRLGYLVAWKMRDEITNNSTTGYQTDRNSVNDSQSLFDSLKISDQKEKALFKLFLSLEMRQMVERELGVDISKFSLRTQYQFLKFLSSRPNQEMGRFKMFFAVNGKEEKNSRVVSFLSLEQGEQEMGDRILLISEKLPPETANAIFAKYGEIVEAAKGVGGYLRATFGADRNYDEREIQNITEQMLRGGKELLVGFADKLTAGGEVINSTEIMADLAEAQTDIIMFGNAFREIQPDLDEVLGARFEKVPWSALNKSEKDEMWKIAQKNWAGREQAGVEVLGGFKNILENEADGGASDFFLYKKDGKLISFIRFYPDDQDYGDNREHVHAHSFNVSPNLRGKKIGTAMAIKMLRGEAQKGKVVHGSVYPEVEMGEKYVEEVGFNLAGVYHDAPEKKFEFDLICNLEKNNLFASRPMKAENLRALAVAPEQAVEAMGQNADMVVFKIDLSTESAQLEAVARALFSEGYVGTRYWIEKKERYFVFEKNKALPAAKSEVKPEKISTQKAA